jgi:hypothetical protein
MVIQVFHPVVTCSFLYLDIWRENEADFDLHQVPGLRIFMPGYLGTEGVFIFAFTFIFIDLL